MNAFVLMRGGGDLASGAALRLRRAGFAVVITELAEPLCVRRSVAFAEAVYEGMMRVEGVTARLAQTPEEIPDILQQDEIPVLVDPEAQILHDRRFTVQALVDVRLLKTPAAADYLQAARLVIGAGPGFTAGVNCHAAVETQRGHTMGRVYWQGSTSPDTGQPDGDPRRVLRAPCDGVLAGYKEIGEHCEAGERIAGIVVDDGRRTTDPGGQQTAEAANMVYSPFAGVLRGLLHPGLRVRKGIKLGDVDPRDEARLCQLASDKALAVGGGVLEALLTKKEMRPAAPQASH